jgi:solute carrier family 25 uncoupling protein 27
VHVVYKGTGMVYDFAYKYMLSACAATVAETVTFPLDLTKTRLQIQGEGTPSPTAYRGMLKTAVGIVKEEGVLKLWQGVSPAVLRHLIYTGCRMGFYEQLRENVLGRSPDGHYPFYKAVLGGGMAGAAAQFIASPTDLVKVQMQMEGKRRLEGEPVRVRGTIHAFAKILKEGGIPALWKGWVPNVQRAALVNMGDLTAYDTTKQAILRYTPLQDNVVTHSIASGVSGLVAAIVGTPADVVKTRIMNQPQLYRSSLQCLTLTVKNEGVLALWKGFIPIWARMAPWSLTFWISYEQIRRLAGTSSF